MIPYYMSNTEIDALEMLFPLISSTLVADIIIILLKKVRFKETRSLA